MKGTLAPGSIPHLLRAIYVGRGNGSLHVVNGEVRHSLRFRRGHLVNARTNEPGERLGEMMVRRGLLTTADLARATTQVIRTRKRLGAVLLEMGVIDEQRLAAAVETHVRELLALLFSWKQGSYVFEDEPEAETKDELTLEVPTGELILEAVRAVRDPLVVREALGDADRVLGASTDPLLRFQKLTLSPADGFVLSRIDGTTSAREVVQMIPLPAEEVERSLLNLLSTGVIEFTGSVRRSGAQPAPGPAAGAARRPSPPPPPPPAPAAPAATRPAVAPPAPAATGPVPAPPQPAPPRPAVAPAPEKPPPAPSPAPAAGPSPEDERTARRREIVEAAQGLKERDHFQVLGLTRAAREAEIKEAYFRLAKRFHPDVHHTSELADLREPLEAVFIRLGEAYEVLRDPRKRADYEDRLGRPRPAPPPPVAEPQGARAPAAAPAGRQPVEPAADVDYEASFRAALRHYEAEHFWDAIQCLEPVADKAPGKLGSAMKVLLARCYLRNPKWARRAEETLLAVTRNDPASADAWYVLGSIYAEKGMRNRACSMYRKVVELKPEHEEANAYLAQHGDDHPDDNTPGVLRRLFRRS